MGWRSLHTVLGRDKSGDMRRQARLTQAYRAVFQPGLSASSEDKEIVLADLLHRSGFNKYFGPEVSSDHLRYAEGMRALYGHIFGFLSLSDEDMAALERAARVEAVNHSETREFIR